MTKLKKTTLYILCLLLALSVMFFAGCASYFRNKAGDFVYGNYNDGYVYIIELTDAGAQKQFLYVPSQLNDKPVGHIGRSWPMYSWTSENIEKIYFDMNFASEVGVLEGCKNLDKIFFIRFNSDNKNVNLIAEDGYRKYISFTTFQELKENNIIENYQLFPSNVSYYYNYKNSENDGYYWIDDCDYGGIIEFIPPEPTREGYTFVGWYKEEECINRWNFESDTIPVEQILVNDDGKEETLYQETRLYAKWVKTK